MNNGSRSFDEGYSLLLKKIRARYGDPGGGKTGGSNNVQRTNSENHEPSFIEYEGVQHRFRALLDETVGYVKRMSAPKITSVEAIRQSIVFYCAVDRAEQRLIEGAIEAIAGAHPDLFVIKDNKNIPITEEAYRFTRDNARQNLDGIRLRYAGKKHHDYVPSALFVKVKSNTAFLVDYKRLRSEAEFEMCKLDMRSAELLLPHWLYDMFNGLHVSKVITSIVSDKRSRDYVAYPEEKLCHLDDIIFVRGAEFLIEEVRIQFAASVKVLAR